MNPAMFILLALVAQATSPSADPEAKAHAQALLSEGAQLFERGAMAEALEKFNQAYEEFPSPKLLFNIGQSSRNLGRAVEAMMAFERFVAEDPDAPVEMTNEARKSMAQLRATLGKLSIECGTAGAELGLDGRNIGFAPLANPLWVMPGNHLLTAKHPNFLPASVTVDVNAGTVHTVVMPMQPVYVAAMPNPSASVPPAAKDPSAADRRTGLTDSSTADTEDLSRRSLSSNTGGWWLGRKWTWVAASSAVVFVGTAAAFGLSAQSKFNSLNNSCGSGGTGLGCSDADINSVTWRQNAANVFWGLSAAAAVTTGVLFLVEGRTVSVTPVAGEATGLIARVGY
jgi:hypothetical protein